MFAFSFIVIASFIKNQETLIRLVNHLITAFKIY